MWDSNSRPHTPKVCALANCANFRKKLFNFLWFSSLGLNQEPRPYKSRALTNCATGEYKIMVETMGVEPIWYSRCKRDDHAKRSPSPRNNGGYISDSNWCTLYCKYSALPTKLMTPIKMVLDLGFEPKFVASKAIVLPLDESRINKIWSEWEDSNLHDALRPR